MKIKEVSYTHSFNIGSFLNDKAGIVIELEEGDTVEEAFEAAIAETHAVAKRVKDGVNGTVYNGQEYTFSGLPEIDKVRDKYNSLEAASINDADSNKVLSLKDQVSFCYDKAMLEQVYFPLIDKNKKLSPEEKRELWLAYDEQFAKLSNQKQ